MLTIYFIHRWLKFPAPGAGLPQPPPGLGLCTVLGEWGAHHQVTPTFCARCLCLFFNTYAIRKYPLTWVNFVNSTCHNISDTMDDWHYISDTTFVSLHWKLPQCKSHVLVSNTYGAGYFSPYQISNTTRIVLGWYRTASTRYTCFLFKLVYNWFQVTYWRWQFTNSLMIQSCQNSLCHCTIYRFRGVVRSIGGTWSLSYLQFESSSRKYIQWDTSVHALVIFNHLHYNEHIQRVLFLLNSKEGNVDTHYLWSWGSSSILNFNTSSIYKFVYFQSLVIKEKQVS